MFEVHRILRIPDAFAIAPERSSMRFQTVAFGERGGSLLAYPNLPKRPSATAGVLGLFWPRMAIELSNQRFSRYV